MRNSVGVALLVVGALAGSAAAEEQTYQGHFDDELDAKAAAAGVPQPPTTDRAEYAAWKKKLAPGARRKLVRFCTRHQDTYLRTCNGFGPLAVPMYPQLDASMQVSATELAAYHASLTAAQRQYLRPRCRRAAQRAVHRDGIGGEDLACETQGTPLVLAFDGGPVRYTGDGEFALVPGQPRRMAWPTADTPWLALDRNGNGVIDDGGELFGSGTTLPHGRLAGDGFAALAVLDANDDGVIDAADPAYPYLLLWADRDGDRRSSAGELEPLSARVDALDLRFTRAPRCDGLGNCEVERSTMTWRDATGARRIGALVDVHLRLLPLVP